MKNTPDPTFEAIHLVSILLSRFNSVCKRCMLVEEELYILAFIKFQGEDQAGKRYLLRRDVTALLKKVFHSSDGQVSLWVGQLCGQKLLSEQTLTSKQQQLYASSRGPKYRMAKKALFLTTKGDTKVATFLTSLAELRDEVMNEELVVPGLKEAGLFGKNIVGFIQFALANRHVLLPDEHSEQAS